MERSEKIQQKRLRKHQLDSADLLKRLALFLEDNKIDYFIGAGTLLGVVRHGGFIPWDDDIDIFMEYDQLQKLFDWADNKSLEILRDYGLRIGRLDADPYYLYIAGEQDINIRRIDIFPCQRHTNYYWPSLVRKLMGPILFFKVAIALDLQGVFPDRKGYIKSWLPLFFLGDISFERAVIRRIVFRFLFIPRFFWRLCLPGVLFILMYLQKRFIHKEGRWLFAYYRSRSPDFYGDYNSVFPTKKVSFEGVTVRAPRNLDDALQAYFDKHYAKFPSKNLSPKHFKFDE